jgi:hypothetical protein
MIVKFIWCTALSALVLNGCAAENVPVSQTKPAAPPARSLAVPSRGEAVETPKFKELKKKAELAAAEFKRIEEARTRLLIVYTEEHPKVKKASRALDSALKASKSAESLLNTVREKLEYRVKTPPV